MRIIRWATRPFGYTACFPSIVGRLCWRIDDDVGAQRLSCHAAAPREICGNHRSAALRFQRGDHRKADRAASDDQGNRLGVHPRLGNSMQANGEGIGQNRVVCRAPVWNLQHKGFAKTHLLRKAARQAIGKA